MLKQGTLTEGGWISTIALNSSDQLLLIMKIYFFLFHKTAYLNEEVDLPLLLVFPGLFDNDRVKKRGHLK
jgi:hypothetical protein